MRSGSRKRKIAVAANKRDRQKSGNSELALPIHRLLLWHFLKRAHCLLCKIAATAGSARPK
jgi:hypothetical protein